MIFEIRDASDLQPAINEQQRLGGELVLPPRDIDTQTLNPFISAPLGDAQRPLAIRGQGMLASTLRLDHPNAMLLGYGKVKGAQLVLGDLTLDGNYQGAGGLFPQPASGAWGLIGAYTPFTVPVGYGTPPNGLFHEFRRVRFYRAQGFTFFPSQGVRCQDCVFDQVGQPDQPMHYDCLGSGGATDAVVDNSLWINSAGNYADFVGQAATPSRLTFRGNESRKHGVGGIYALGYRSLITGNDLQSLAPGSGIGYDVTTETAGRGYNIVAHNSLVNLHVDPGVPTDILTPNVVLERMVA